MRMELDLVRASVTPDPKTSPTPSRRELRLATDALIADGQLDLVGVVERSCQIMLVVAKVLAQFEQDPQIPDLTEASTALIEDARAVMDRGLMLNDWATVRCGAVMVEIVVRGLCASFNVPYDKVLTEIHQAQCAGESPQLRPILEAAGLLQPEPPEAANDPTGDPT